MGPVLILVPSFCGSREIAGENLRTVAGVPLVGRAAHTAVEALSLIPGAGHRVVCFTDDEVDAQVAREWGADVPFLRPAELARGEASSIDLVLYALDHLDGGFETVVLLRPACPLTSPDDVVTAVRLHGQCRAPVIGVTRCETPFERTYSLGPEGRLVQTHPVEAGRQQGPSDRWRANGGIFVADVHTLRRERGFLTADTRGHAMPAERSLDLEAGADASAAEAILERAPVAPVLIAGRSIGPGHPCFVIAEIGVNHNGDLDLALRMIDAAAQAGADAAKFQTFRTERVISRAARQAEYQRRNTGVAESQFEMVRRLELGDAAFARLAERCAQKGILFLSSPFDEGSAELLDDLGVPAFKIGSGELTNHPFLASLARRGRPLLLSTGMATLREVDLALAVIRRYGNPPVALLHCVSSYPSPAGESNLAAIETMRRAFNVPVGWSDHSLGIHVSIAAVARGACILERHFTLDRTLPGPDHAASLDPVEFGRLVMSVRDVEAAIGSGMKLPRDSERDTAEVARRSLHVARDLAAGTRLTPEDLVLLRPGTGLPPSALATTVGRTTRRALGAGEMLEEADLE